MLIAQSKPGKSSLRAALGERGHRRAGLGDQRRAVDDRRVGADAHDEAADASVRNDEVTALAEQEGRHACLACELNQPDELVDRRRRRQAIGAAPDAQRRQGRERDVCPQLDAALDGEGVEPIDRVGDGRAHADVSDGSGRCSREREQLTGQRASGIRPAEASRCLAHGGAPTVVAQG